jgi:negative regulator of replication initiation
LFPANHVGAQIYRGISRATSGRNHARETVVVGGRFGALGVRFVARLLRNPANRFMMRSVKNIEVSDDVYTVLQQLATGFHRTPDDVLASLLEIPRASPEAAEPLAAFVLSAEFRAKFTDADKYLGILAWVAERHAAEFGEFILSQTSGRRYLSRSREEILETCRHNQARQIDGTQYWAIMNIDTATERRFLARVLEFIGYRDAVIEFTCSAIGMKGAARRERLRALAA